MRHSLLQFLSLLHNIQVEPGVRAAHSVSRVPDSLPRNMWELMTSETNFPLPPEALPRHLAIIMDGNGRWAQARGLSRSEGHRAGANTVRDIVTRCRELGIAHLTLYAFSSENWNRPRSEVSALFSLLLEFIQTEVPRMLREGISLKVFGDIEGLPLAVRTALKLAIKTTAKGTAMDLNLALNYGARAEIVRAVQKMLADGVKPEDVNEELISSCLYSAGQPDPDLVIRTSGEQRLSNFLLYQCAYAEFYFTPRPWPDFDKASLDEALADFARRQRRFGKTQEQVDAQETNASGGNV